MSEKADCQFSHLSQHYKIENISVQNVGSFNFEFGEGKVNSVILAENIFKLTQSDV